MISVGVYGPEHQNDASSRLDEYIFWLEPIISDITLEKTETFIENCKIYFEEYTKQDYPSHFIKDLIETGYTTEILVSRQTMPGFIIETMITSWAYFSVLCVLPYGYYALTRDFIF